MSQRHRATTTSGVVLALLLGTLSLSAAVAPAAVAAQPVPSHTRLAPEAPRTNTPRISDGEIWDIEVLGSRVFIAGTFTSIADVAGTTTPLAQAGLAAYDINTGKIDRTFRPTFGGGGVNAVEASPDGTALYVAGSFSSVNGVTKRKVARLNLTTGAAVAAFTANASARATALAVTDTWVYVGGQFLTVNGTSRVGLAALNRTTGVVDPAFNLPISGGIGVNGALTVQQLKLTHDESKLLVVHTGRKIAGQDRLAAGLINTGTKQLLPWRTRLWDDNLARVGGVTRVYAADIAPNDQYFVLASGSGGDAPPISDTAVAYPIAGGDFTEPLWISRAFDSIYSVAITEQAVYIGGHFNWLESPTAAQPWPGLTNVGYGNGQGLSGYGLGDEVVHRDHLGALNPTNGTALEWDPGSDSFEGNKAMEATTRGLFVGGDGNYQNGLRTGRVAFYDFNAQPAVSTTDTTITAPIAGRVVASGTEFTVTGNATNPVGIRRVQVEIQDRDTKRYLQDDLVTWGAQNNVYATLGAGTTSRSWSQAYTITGTRRLLITAKTYGTNSVNDATKALKKFESFNFADQTPTTSITGPSGIQTSLAFTMTGSAQDDLGVNSLTYYFQDENNLYLQDDGSAAAIYNTFRGTPDVIGAAQATWSYNVVLPYEGVWTANATAVDTTGQADLRSAARDFTVNSNAVAPVVTIAQPVPMTPPFAVAPVVLTPGGNLTFSGTATDDDRVRSVEISLRNTTTRENLAADGTWGVGITAGNHRISDINLSATSYNWSYTTPFQLTPGTYTFSVRATDNDDLITATANRGVLTLSVQVPGDNPPTGLMTVTGTLPLTAPQITVAGTASDDFGVAAVDLTVYDNDTGRYLQDDLMSMSSTHNTIDTALGTPGGTSTTWSRLLTLPTGGDFSITAFVKDTSNQLAASTTGATVRYTYYPGDAPPIIEPALLSPITGGLFSQGKIVVTGRATDDFSMSRVEVAIINGANQYMSSLGAFTSTTVSWRTAFLNSPGSPGSNYSFTTPVIPDGTYQVKVRARDQHNQYGPEVVSTGIVVTHPANNPPVAAATYVCAANVCTFDARTSTDENPTALTYSWNFGNGTGSGPVPVRTYTAAGLYNVILTATDEWGVPSTFTIPVTIAVPGGNQPPVPVFATNCIALVCSTSSTGTVDPNLGDVITYAWQWGDLTPNNTGPAATHTYSVPGTYTVTMTATDGWLASATTTRTLVIVEPVTNVAPVPVFTVTCVVRTCTMKNTTTDPNGDVVRYAWTFGTLPETTSTASAPQKVYLVAGTYTITLTATDGWNKSATTTSSVTIP